MAENKVRRRRNRANKSKTFPSMKPDTGFHWNGCNTFLIVVLGIAISLCAIICYIPSPIDPLFLELKPPPELVGALEPNTLLQNAERLYENKVKGPESLVVDGENIYTGTADGKILHLKRGEIRELANLGRKPCGSFEDEPTCGRPLGMRLTKDGFLIVADAYLGLFRVNVQTGEIFYLWPSQFTIGGDKMMFLNDITIRSDGIIYMTDSSTKWQRRYNRYAIMEAELSGRLIEYDATSNTSARIARQMSFPNGVQISKNEDYLLICETNKAQILKYYLKGRRKGEIEVFLENLPGLPDNIRPSSNGYWIAMAIVRHSQVFSPVDFGAQKPWLKRLLAKILPQEFFTKSFQKYGLIIEIDEEGNILRSLHDPTGKVVPSVSEVEEHDGYLYLGSYYLPFISKVKL